MASHMIRGSSVETGLFHVTAYNTYVPRDSFESADFRVRCDSNPVLWRNPMPRGLTQKLLVNKRLEYVFYVHRIPDNCGLDLKYVRYEREIEYVNRLAAILQDPSWLDDKSFFDHRLLLLTHNPFVPMDGLSRTLARAEAVSKPSSGIGQRSGAATSV